MSDTCFYCDRPILMRLERDHMPIPKRNGGTHTVPTCVPCHDLKDRFPLDQWPLELMMQAFKECGPMGRIYLAKAFAIESDRQALSTHP